MGGVPRPLRNLFGVVCGGAMGADALIDTGAILACRTDQIAGTTPAWTLLGNSVCRW